MLASEENLLGLMVVNCELCDPLIVSRAIIDRNYDPPVEFEQQAEGLLMMSLRDDMLAGGRPPPDSRDLPLSGQNGCRQMLAELWALDRSPYIGACK